LPIFVQSQSNAFLGAVVQLTQAADAGCAKLLVFFVSNLQNQIYALDNQISDARLKGKDWRGTGKGARSLGTAKIRASKAMTYSQCPAAGRQICDAIEKFCDRGD